VKDVDTREAAFIGRITAGITHEMKNVLAIIRESAGLMEDLLSMTGDTGFPHRERFVRAMGTIQAQVERGIDLSTRLNRLAHSPDAPLAVIDLNQTVSQMALLAERFARLRGVRLTAAPHPEAIRVSTSPVRVQMALLAGLESMWNSMAGGGGLTLCVSRIGAEAEVAIRCDEAPAEPEEFEKSVSAAPERKMLEEILADLGGKLRWDSSFCGHLLRFQEHVS
jgi:C4-dicarboxylate-specific signal transduction histidine kinase